MIGTVVDFKTDAVGNNYTIKVKTATNFNTIQYVNIIANHYYEEQHKLDSTTIKNHLKSIGD
jgi:rod shape-determining protein MreC